MCAILVTLVMALIIPPRITAQDHKEWGLPQNAKARLGKGTITGNLIYSPDGKHFAVPCSTGVWVYDAHLDKPLQMLIANMHLPSCVAYSPTGILLASGGWDNIIRLRDVHTGDFIVELKGHTYPVNSVAFSPDGNTLASGSSDATVILWEIGK